MSASDDAVRVVAVRAREGELPEALREAVLEDVIDLVAGTPLVTPAVVSPPELTATCRRLSWPQMPIEEHATDAGDHRVLAAMAARWPAATAVCLVCADVPDLPTLVFGKLFSALAGGAAEVAVCPAAGSGGLVALAARCPVPSWLDAAAWDLDDPTTLSRLQHAAPGRALAVVPGWHRLRTLADTNRLDRGLEGWEATRLALRELSGTEPTGGEAG